MSKAKLKSGRRQGIAPAHEALPCGHALVACRPGLRTARSLPHQDQTAVSAAGSRDGGTTRAGAVDAEAEPSAPPRPAKPTRSR